MKATFPFLHGEVSEPDPVSAAAGDFLARIEELLGVPGEESTTPGPISPTIT